MTLRLSVSIGIAQWSEPAEEPSSLVMRADAALYQAKLRGRDCVVVDAPDIEPSSSPAPPRGDGACAGQAASVTRT